MASAALLSNLEKSKQSALAAGNIIEFKKSDVPHTHSTKAQQKIKYRWYQTPSKVGIEIPHVTAKKEELKVKFGEQSVTIDFPISGSHEHFHLDLDLFGPIIKERSKKLHRLDSIEVMMEKKEQNSMWVCLARDGPCFEAEDQTSNFYPSSAKNKRNWDKIDKEIDQEIAKNGEQYGEDPGMQFFKEIFKNADEDKRRAMIKSMQTSGGTVLSTDWDDVSKKDYENKDRPSPPKGQEWRKRQY